MIELLLWSLGALVLLRVSFSVGRNIGAREERGRRKAVLAQLQRAANQAHAPITVTLYPASDESIRAINDEGLEDAIAEVIRESEERGRGNRP
jgi:hypothetical protein